VSIRTLYFIGQCLSLDEHPAFRETIIVQFSDPEYDWNSFIWTCSNHLVLPAIYLKFRDHKLLSYLPEVLAQHLEEIYKLNRARNEQILLQVKAINGSLNRAGISPIYLKGTGNLIDDVYSDTGERIIGDIDFLVPERDLFIAAEIFKEEGYRISFPSFAPFNTSKHHHYPRLWREDVVADIEIHWSPVNTTNAVHFSADLVQKNKKIVTGYPGCFVLSDDHKVILSFIHSQLTNSGHRLGIVSLRDIVDIYRFSKRTDITNVLPQIHQQRKAGAYFDIMQKLMGLTVTGKQTLTSKVYCRKHDLNLTSPLFSVVNRLPWVLTRLLLHGYPDQIKEAFIYKGAQQALITRLSSKKWYQQHFRLLRKSIIG